MGVKLFVSGRIIIPAMRRRFLITRLAGKVSTQEKMRCYELCGRYKMCCCGLPNPATRRITVY